LHIILFGYIDELDTMVAAPMVSADNGSGVIDYDDERESGRFLVLLDSGLMVFLVLYR